MGKQGKAAAADELTSEDKKILVKLQRDVNREEAAEERAQLAIVKALLPLGKMSRVSVLQTVDSLIAADARAAGMLEWYARGAARRNG